MISSAPFTQFTQSNSGVYEQPHSSAPYYPQQQQSLLANAYAAHSTPVMDTPHTLYNSSPRTEDGDGDVAAYDSDDDGGVWSRDHDKEHKGPSTVGSLGVAFASTSPKTYTLGDLETNGAPSSAQIQQFASRLQDDIKSASLFPPALTQASGPIVQQLPPTPTQVHNSATAVQSVRPDVMPPQPAASHTLNASAPIQIPQYARAIASLPRRAAAVWYPQAPPVLRPEVFSRYQRSLAQPQVCVTMKDLIRQDAVYGAATHPEEDAVERLSPNMDVDDDGQYPESYEQYLYNGPSAVDPIVTFPVLLPTPAPQLAQSVAPVAAPVQAPALVQAVSSANRPLRTAVKRAMPTDEDYDPAESDVDAVGESDDEFKAPAHARAAVSPVRKALKAPKSPKARTKRARVSPAPSSFRDDSPAPVDDAVEEISSRPRNLLPENDDKRIHPCQDGCADSKMFTTPYEVHRHREDHHARNEALRLSGFQDNEPVVPGEFKVLISIGNKEKWDTRAAAMYKHALTRADAPLDAGLAGPLKEFANEWKARYECPKCGTHFSRMDSKKRHYEKQCKYNH